MTETLRNILLRATRRGDIVLAIMLGIIVFLIILPMPTWLMDFFIALNIGIAIILLMVGIYVNQPLEFASFPSVLLLSTLFRLAISIATTKLILLYADAGQLVEGFGNFVVGGNIVVGLVIFLIITIVQFVVITKGSERVAEVSARFSLDGMPGKQMSIDADLRSGVIDADEAFERRTSLEKQSQLYGSMDGAMKFVKGDAIAGLCIIFVNLLGGIAIGTLQLDMEIGDAMRRFSILTIGDGLVSQIPALLIAITSGIIVTRVTTSDSKDNLGADIVGQLLGQPSALIVGGIAVTGMSFIKGFPWWAFAPVGLLILVTGIVLKGAAQEKEEAERLTSAMVDDSLDPQQETDIAIESHVPTAPLAIWLSRDNEVLPSVPRLNDELASIRNNLYRDLGVPFPGIQLRYRDDMDSNTYVIAIHDIPLSTGAWKNYSTCVAGNQQVLDLLELEYSSTKISALPDLLHWVPEDLTGELHQAGLITLTKEQIIARHLSHVARKNAAEFLGLQESRRLLNYMEKDFPDLVKEALSLIPVQRIAEVFKRLVAEDISIRDMRAVLEALVTCGQTEKDPALLTEWVRTKLNRQISYRFCDASNVLPVLLLDEKTEETIRGGIRQTPQGSFLALDGDVTRRLIEILQDRANASVNKRQPPVLLTSLDLRRFIKRLLDMEKCDLPVLSYPELITDIIVQPLDQITMADISSN